MLVFKDSVMAEESLFKKDGGVISELNLLYDEGTPVLVGFEQEESGGIRVWKIIDGQIKEVFYESNFFFGYFQCSRVHMNCLWTLDDFGALRMTPLCKLLNREA